MERRITIIRLRRPAEHQGNINQELQWFGESLGLFGNRDKDKSCFRIFVELLKASKQEKQLSSDDLSENLGLARGTVVHHLNNLMETGIVIQTRKKYKLRDEELRMLIEDLHKDFEKTFEEIRKTAEELDRYLGL
ncbi:helix-turn-helix transcriptional regulator [Candidatus Woesearchaeota archaeon]|nr:helix-turn-helix transcriptional regulator [Candidatus Woesearchaeota archaeon]